ncbi:hypothetical protein K466DRAFT_174117 [Polyporus arcularius HHB13444]|uniref:F-box domain-containing protein n=1 Tax=Polyporus arcularius HHB13444 TaxID=1314778 RepID=A0A5C3PCB4_9APHY|nr:hypothetical protein K466DRAFT_174117 [Polyporus arcularius HHB13444]
MDIRLELTPGYPPAAATTPPCFPPELIDEVIACAWPDTETLLSCALVCSGWLPAARYHLFRDVHLDSPHKYDTLVSLVRSGALNSYLLYVRSLNLADAEEAPDEEWKGKRRVQPLLTRTGRFRFFVHDFAGRLPNLAQLTLSGPGVEWSLIPPHPSAFLALSTFPSIGILELRNCRLPSFACLRRALTILPSLTKLTLSSVKWPRSTALLHLSHGAQRTARPILTSLSIIERAAIEDGFLAHSQGFNVRQFLAWLSSTPTSASLREFRFNINGAGPGDYLSYVRSASRMSSFRLAISTLHVTLFYHEICIVPASANAESQLLCLTQFPSLKSIDLTLELEFDCSWYLKVIPYLEAMKQLGVVRLHTLAILRVLIYDTHSEAATDALDVVDTLLEGEHFTELKAVIISVFYRHNGRESENEVRMVEAYAREALRTRLPRLTRRGVLQIHVFHLRWASDRLPPAYPVPSVDPMLTLGALRGSQRW